MMKCNVKTWIESLEEKKKSCISARSDVIHLNYVA